MVEEIIDPIPELTPERLAENQEFQEEMRKKYRLRPPKNHAERVILDNLNVIAALRLQQRTAKDAELLDALEIRITRLRNDTAIWMKSLGMFTEAAKLATKPRMQAENAELDAALRRDDGEWCEHPKWKEVDGKKVPNYSREFDFSANGRQLSMLQCSECGFRNGRELPKDLANLSRRRAEIRKVMSDRGLKTLEDVKKAGINIDLGHLANG